jgi:hypothetical protein
LLVTDFEKQLGRRLQYLDTAKSPPRL